MCELPVVSVASSRALGELSLFPALLLLPGAQCQPTAHHQLCRRPQEGSR